MAINCDDKFKAVKLLSCVSDTVYWRLFDCGFTTNPDWESIVQFLHRVYGDKKLAVEYESELMRVRCAQDEPVRCLAERLKLLARKAEIPISNAMMLEQFLRAIGSDGWVNLLHTIIRCKNLKNWNKIVREVEICEKGGNKPGSP